MSTDSSNSTSDIPSQGDASNENKKMEGNNNKNTGEIFTELRKSWNQFQLRKTIESTRETINNHVLNNSIVQGVFRLGSHTWTWREDFDKEMTQCSNTLNSKYPAFSSFARNHEALVISGTTLFVAIPSRRLKMFFLPITIFTAASMKAVIWTFDYKWSKDTVSSSNSDDEKAN